MYFAAVADRTKLLAVGGAAALPVVQGLVGAAAALSGSLMAAGAGAAAVGVGAGGALAAGVGSVASVAGPAQAALEQATRDQEAYNAAVAEHGRTSRQATAARRALDRTFAGQPGLQRAAGELGALRRDWSELTTPGRRDWFGLRGDVAAVTRRAAPGMARNANGATTATRAAGVRQAQFLAGDFAQDTVAALTREFVHDLPAAERTLENLEVTLGRVALAALPFFGGGVEFVEDTTVGWRSATSDTAALRRTIGGYVDDARAWANLTGSGLALAEEVLTGGRPAGRSVAEDLTGTLDRWTGWLDRHPGEVDMFFRDAADDVEDLAGGVAALAVGVHDLATQLRPLLGPLAGVASLGGDALSVLGPAGLAVAWGAGRQLGRPPTAAAPIAPQAAALGVTGGALVARRWAGTGAPVSQLGARPTLAARGGAAAARVLWPVALFGGVLGAGGALSMPGANPGRTGGDRVAWGIRNAAQGAGAMLLPGIVNPVLGEDSRVARGQARALQVLAELPGGEYPTGSEARRARAQLAPRIGEAEQAVADATFDGHRNELAERLAFLKTLRAQARAYRSIVREADHLEEVEANQRSREHGHELAGSWRTAFGIYSGRSGPEEAMQRVTEGVYTQLREMRPVGAKILSESVLSWAGDMAEANPALADEVDRLARRVERSFSRTGAAVRVVNGRILTGSRNQWRTIAAGLVDPAQQALAATSEAFQSMRAEAVAELELMGFSHDDAVAVFRGVRRGSISPAAVNVRTGSGQSRVASDANLARAHGYTTPVTGTGRKRKEGDGAGSTSAVPLPALRSVGPWPAASLSMLSEASTVAVPTAGPRRSALARVSPDTAGPGIVDVAVDLPVMTAPTAGRQVFGRSPAGTDATSWPGALSVSAVSTQVQVDRVGPDAADSRAVFADLAVVGDRPRLLAGPAAAAPASAGQDEATAVEAVAARELVLAPEIDLEFGPREQMREELTRKLRPTADAIADFLLDDEDEESSAPPLRLVS